MSIPPPDFFSLGMPPANKPPSCGALLIVSDGVAALSLRILPAPPGIGGAPPIGGPEGPFDSLPTIGAERSFVTAFFNLFPAWISPNNAPYIRC